MPASPAASTTAAAAKRSGPGRARAPGAVAVVRRRRPARMMFGGPRRRHGPAHDALDRRRLRRAQRDPDVAADEHAGDDHRRVVQRKRAGQAEIGVALAEPQQRAGDREQHRQRRLRDRVRLLAGVEAPRRRRPPPAQPAQVVGVEVLELAARAAQRAAVAEQRDERERRQPRRRRHEVDRLHQRARGEHLRDRRDVQHEARREHHDERRAVDRVQVALGRAEAHDPRGAGRRSRANRARRRVNGHWSRRSRRRGHSRAAASSRRRRDR